MWTGPLGAVSYTHLKRLFNGDLSGYVSWDDAVFTLSRWLAFWTGKDPEQMDRIIRTSGIYRPEWDAMLESGDTYGMATTTAAINMQSEIYKGQALSLIHIFSKKPRV